MNARDAIEQTAGSTSEEILALRALVWRLLHDRLQGSATIDHTPPPAGFRLQTADHPTSSRYFLLKAT